MKFITYILLISFLIPSLLTAEESDDLTCIIKDHKGRSRETNIDISHMKLEVSFEVMEKKVIGDVTYEFTPIRKSIDTILLDAVKMNIQSVEVDREDVKFRSTEDHLIVYLNESSGWGSEHTLQINYEASPKKGIYFIGWDDPSGKSLKQIWTQGQGIDNRHWIPSYDFQNDKLITETIIYFDKEYEVISNGELVEETSAGENEKKWHYKMTKPHVSYLVMIAIGNYDHVVMKGENEVEIRQYYYEGEEHKAEPSYMYSVEMMDWMEEEFGVPYPWTTYANVPVRDFIYGAMENTTATIFTDYYLQDERGALERNYVGTNAHELVHQWFGDYVTAWSGHDHWLHESFATHYAKEFRRHIYGDNEYQRIKFRETLSALKAGEKNDYPIVHSRAGSSRHYPKGSFVIGMMKDIVGKEQFDKVLKYFLESHAYGMVDTHDFFQSFLKVLGMNLDWFFDQWLYRGGEPFYKITQEINKYETILYVEQIQETGGSVGYFKMPVDFDVYYEGNSVVSHREWVNGPKDTVVIPNETAKNVAFVIFDVNNKILKNTEYTNKSSEEWINQALMAENMIDRYIALRNLRDEEIKDKRKELLEVYDNEKFSITKQEVVSQLAADDNKKSQILMVRALLDPNVYVRREVIENVEEIPKKYLSDYEEMLKDLSYVNIEKTLEKLCELYPENKEKYLAMTEGEKGMQHNIEIARLSIQMEEERAALDRLIELTGPSYGFRTRIAAIDAIKDVDECNKYILNNLSNAMLHFNRRLSRSARSALKSMCGIDDKRLQVESFYEEGDWNEDQQKAWKKVFDSVEETDEGY